MDLFIRLGVNRSDTCRYREDLQRRMADEDTASNLSNSLRRGTRNPVNCGQGIDQSGVPVTAHLIIGNKYPPACGQACGQTVG